MKNVQVLPRRSMSFRVPIQGMPPLRGWAVRYISGMDEMEEVKVGHWLAKWFVTTEDVQFSFEPTLHMAFKEEKDAIDISTFLLKNADIKTEVVKIG